MLQVVAVYSACYHNHRYGPRAIPFHTFCYIADGRATYWLNRSDRPLTLGRGSLLWLPHMTVRQFSTDSMQLFAIRFRVADSDYGYIPDELAGYMTDTPRVVTTSAHAHMEQLFKEAEHLSLRDDLAAYLELRAILMQVISHYLQALQQSSRPHLHEQVARVRSHMVANLDRPELSLTDLAALTGWSQSYLIRAFRQVTGDTPMAYLRRLRINRSLDLLSSGEFTVSQAAERCGFSDPAYFSRAFARQLGKPPTAYLPDASHSDQAITFTGRYQASRMHNKYIARGLETTLGS